MAADAATGARRLRRLAEHLNHQRSPPATAAGGQSEHHGSSDRSSRRSRRLSSGTAVSAVPVSAREMTRKELYQLDTLGYLRVENCIDRATINAAWDATERVIDTYGEGRQPLSIHEDAKYGDKFRNAFLLVRPAATAPGVRPPNPRLCLPAFEPPAAARFRHDDEPAPPSRGAWLSRPERDLPISSRERSSVPQQPAHAQHLLRPVHLLPLPDGRASWRWRYVLLSHSLVAFTTWVG